MNTKNSAIDMDRDTDFKYFLKAVAVSEVANAEHVVDKLIEAGIGSMGADKDREYYNDIISRAVNAETDLISSAAIESGEIVSANAEAITTAIELAEMEIDVINSKLNNPRDDLERDLLHERLAEQKAIIAEAREKNVNDIKLGKHSWRLMYKHKGMKHVQLETPEGVFNLGITRSGDVYDVELVTAMDSNNEPVSLGWCASADASVYSVRNRSLNKKTRIEIAVGGKKFNLTKLMYSTFIRKTPFSTWQFRVTHDNWLFIKQNFVDVAEPKEKLKKPTSVMPYGYVAGDKNAMSESVIRELAQLFISWRVRSVKDLLEVTGADKGLYYAAKGTANNEATLDLLVNARAMMIDRCKTKGELESLLGTGYEMSFAGKDYVIFSGGLCMQVKNDGFRPLRIVDIDGTPYYTGLQRVEVGIYLAKAFITKKARPVIDTVTDRRLTVAGNIFVEKNERYTK